jgi:DNA-binding transcriptional LysR family regulator
VLNLTPAAVHTRLKSLEGKLGVPLYETVGHTLHLTEAAEVILPHIRNVILDHEAIFASLREWMGADRGRVRIATGSTFSSYALPSLLEAFRRQSPDVEIVVATGKSRQIFDGLAKGAIDVAITLDTRLVEKPFFQVHTGWDFALVLVGRAGHPGARSRCASWRRSPSSRTRVGRG